MNALQPAAPAQSNAPTFDTIFATVTELGKVSGSGKDTQVKFDLTVCEGAYLGTLSLDPHKHGKEQNDALKLGEAYYRAQTGSMIFNSKADNQRKLVSNVQKFIKLGGCPKFGVGEPMGLVNRFMTRWKKLRQDPANKGKLNDAHNALLKLATAQLKLDTLIPDAEMDSFIFVGEKEPRTPEEWFAAVRKQASKLMEGKLTNCPESDTSPQIKAIMTMCGKRIEDILKARAPGATQAP